MSFTLRLLRSRTLSGTKTLNSFGREGKRISGFYSFQSLVKCPSQRNLFMTISNFTSTTELEQTTKTWPSLNSNTHLLREESTEKTVEPWIGKCKEMARDRKEIFLLVNFIRNESQDKIQSICKEILSDDLLFEELVFGRIAQVELIELMLDKNLFAFRSKIYRLSTVKLLNKTISRLLRSRDEKVVDLLLEELKGKIQHLAKNQYGSFIVREILRKVETVKAQFVWEEMLKGEETIVSLASDNYACFVTELMVTLNLFAFEGVLKDLIKIKGFRLQIERILKEGDSKKIAFICDQLENSVLELSKDPNTTFLIRFIVELGHKTETRKIWNQVFENFEQLERDQCGSAVIKTMIKRDLSVLKGKLLRFAKLRTYSPFILQHFESRDKESLRFAIEEMEGHCKEFYDNGISKFVLLSLFENYSSEQLQPIYDETHKIISAKKINNPKFKKIFNLD